LCGCGGGAVRFLCSAVADAVRVVLGGCKVKVHWFGVVGGCGAKQTSKARMLSKG
jgi:hypothetical protein